MDIQFSDLYVLENTFILSSDLIKSLVTSFSQNYVLSEF